MKATVRSFVDHHSEHQTLMQDLSSKHHEIIKPEGANNRGAVSLLVPALCFPVQ